MKLETFSATGFATPGDPMDTTVAKLLKSLDSQISNWLSEHKLYKEVERSIPSISATAMNENIYLIFVVTCSFEPV